MIIDDGKIAISLILTLPMQYPLDGDDDGWCKVIDESHSFHLMRTKTWMMMARSWWWQKKDNYLRVEIRVLISHRD
jgi:hypothetical protein